MDNTHDTLVREVAEGTKILRPKIERLLSEGTLSEWIQVLLHAQIVTQGLCAIILTRIEQLEKR